MTFLFCDVLKYICVYVYLLPNRYTTRYLLKKILYIIDHMHSHLLVIFANKTTELFFCHCYSANYIIIIQVSNYNILFI